ncbi:hypothetical protein KJ966_24835 [bacterium]|nr:hypothetical protein [bacterium]
MTDFIQTYPNGRYRYLANHKLMLMGRSLNIRNLQLFEKYTEAAYTNCDCTAAAQAAVDDKSRGSKKSFIGSFFRNMRFLSRRR